jgi:hypothetical protein
VNVFNRVIVILSLLATMIVSAIFFIVEANLKGTNQLFQIAGGSALTLFVWIICAAILWLEVRRPRTKTIKVMKISGGEAELTVDSIANRLEYNIDQLADIIKVKPLISPGRKGVKVDLELETSPEIEVPMKTEEVQQLTKDIVETRMGLKLDSVRVLIRHAPYPPATAPAKQ